MTIRATYNQPLNQLISITNLLTNYTRFQPIYITNRLTNFYECIRANITNYVLYQNTY